MPPSAAAASTCSPILPDLSLIVQRIKDPSLQARLVGLSGDDAQCIADFLSALLHDGTLSSEDKKSLLILLQKLVKSAQVLPQSYKLQGIQCDLSQAREGGAFADIFQGEYQGQRICVKAVRIFQRGDNTRMLRAFAKEIVLWAHLSHENILPFYGIYHGLSGRICIVSPWMDAGDLSAYLQEAPHIARLPLASDIAAGLRYLHESNVVHGDLKAKNILVSDHGRALIADFGISRIVVSTKLASTQLSNGTMRWMAPELLKDVGEELPPVTLQSDVWSLGCVYYEILTRKVPFYHCASDARLSLVRLDPKATPSRPTNGSRVDDISDDMWNLMKKCWNHEPLSRPSCSNVHEFITRLTRVREHRSSQSDALWKAIRGETRIEAVCERAYCILFRAFDLVPHPQLMSQEAVWSAATNCRPLNTVYQSSEAATEYAPSNTDSTDTYYTARSSSETTTCSKGSLIDETRLLTPTPDISLFNESDMVIAVMGSTRAGKSTFIEIASGSGDVHQVSHSLRFCTRHVQAVRCDSPLRNQSLVFLDTPGFDDDTRSDMEILAEVATWLAETYKAGIKLSGILYLHRITDTRIMVTLIRYLDMFQNICGNDALSNFRLVTTHWDQLEDKNEGIKNEGRLRKKYWNTFLEKGSMPMERKALRIQKEMVDQHRSLRDTSAARSLSYTVRRAIEALKNRNGQLEELAEKVNVVNSAKHQNHGREPELDKRRTELIVARKMFKNLKENPEFDNRAPTINPNHFLRSPAAESTSNWRYIAHKISDRSAGKGGRRPRYSQTFPESEIAVATPLERNSYVFCDFLSPSSGFGGLSRTIQRLQAIRTTAAPGVMLGFESIVEITLRISEALNETPDAHHSLLSLMRSTSWLLCTLSDKYLPTRGFPSSITETFEIIHRRLVHVQNIVTRLKDSGTEPQMPLSPGDRRAISQCREAVTSASLEVS